MLATIAIVVTITAFGLLASPTPQSGLVGGGGNGMPLTEDLVLGNPAVVASAAEITSISGTSSMLDTLSYIMSSEWLIQPAFAAYVIAPANQTVTEGDEVTITFTSDASYYLWHQSPGADIVDLGLPGNNEQLTVTFMAPNVTETTVIKITLIGVIPTPQAQDFMILTILDSAGNANLGGLMINPGMLSPTFSDSVTAYTASVGNSVSQVILTPTASHDLAMIAVNGTTVTSSIGHTVSLNVGANPIAIVVTAQDSTTIKTYTVTVTRAAPLSSDANLGGLMINPGMLSPTFSDSVTAYTASVGNSVSQVILTPTASHDLAMIAVNGTTVTSSIGHAVSLNVGANPIAIVVTAQDSTTIKTYTVTVTRAAPLSSDANLGGLMINPGMLSPTFSDSVTAYTASVGNSVSQVILTPTASHDLAMIAVNGTTVTSSIGHAVSLNVGANPIAIVVTAQDSTTIKTYTVTVTRAAPLSSDANLGGLMINPGMLSPTFSDSVTAYTASVGNSVSQVILTPTASHDLAMIAVNGTTVTSSIGHTVTDLTEGDNTITVIVTAQDAMTTKTYIITVTVRDAENVPPQPIRDASQKRSSSSSIAPIVDLDTLTNAGIVDIPPHIAEQVASHDDSDPLELLMLDDTFDFPLVINNYGYLLDDVTNTLVPQIVTVGDDDPTVITFTVYTQKDLAHFTLYLNLSDENTGYTNSDTYITYGDDGTTVVTDPHGYIGDDTTITVTQEDDSMPEKKTVSITIEFGEEPMGLTNMVAYMWNTDRKAAFIKIVDALEVVASPEPEVQTADPEPAIPDSELPVDSDPRSELSADPEPVSTDTLGTDDYDEVQVLNIIRMWSGFEPEMITDEQMLASLGLDDDYPDADIPDWVMTELGALAAKGDVTVEEFVLALQYVLEHT